MEFSLLFVEVCEDITRGGVFLTLCGGMRGHNTRWSFLYSSSCVSFFPFSIDQDAWLGEAGAGKWGLGGGGGREGCHCNCLLRFLLTGIESSGGPQFPLPAG